MLRFRLKEEIDGERTIVEVWDGDELVACIYPHETTVTVVSKFLEDIQLDETPPPKATVSFKR